MRLALFLLAFLSSVSLWAQAHSDFPSEQEIDEIFKGFNVNTRTYARGGWTGGGGGGVACWADSNAAKAAFINGRLTEAGRKTIRTLKVLDYFQQENETYFSPEENEDAQGFLHRVVSNYTMKLHPMFAKKLLWALDKLQMSQWRPRSDLPLLLDVGEKIFVRPLWDLDPQLWTECHYVQMALRLVKRKDGHIPPVVIGYDKYLFDLLLERTPIRNSSYYSRKAGVLNQAFLLLHEALYFLGMELEQTNSVGSRKIVGLILSQTYYDIAQSRIEAQLGTPETVSFQFKLKLVEWGFGEHPELFYADPATPKSFPKDQMKSAYRNFLAFSEPGTREFIEKYKDSKVPALLIGLAPEHPPILYYQLKAMKPYMTAENAITFFFLAAIGAQAQGAIQDSDVFRVNGYDDREDFKKVCQFARDRKKGFKSFGSNSASWNRAQEEFFELTLQSLNLTLDYCKSKGALKSR